MNDQEIQEELQAKSLTEARVTSADIEANIVAEHYFTAADGFVGAAWRTVSNSRAATPSTALELLTFCILELRNGYTITGESACVSPKNFDAEVGRRVARANAVTKLWPLMGYALRSKLSEAA